MKVDTESRTADALLDKRLRVSIPAPWLLRLLGIMVVPIWFKRPVYAQLLRISRLYVGMGIDLAELDKGEAMILFSALSKHGITASRIIALGLIRGRFISFLFHRVFAWYLRGHLQADTLAELAKLIVFLSGGENFASIIRSVAYMRVTTPVMSQTKTES